VSRLALALALVAACKSHRPSEHDEPSAAVHIAAPIPAGPWPELATFTHVLAVRDIALPVQAKTPRFDTGGPVLVGDVAVMSSSQFGFVAVDYRTGQIAWAKPAGLHVAPPVARGGDFVLIGECINPPDVPDGERLFGCLRVVTPTGADKNYVAIHARAEGPLQDFATATGPEATWATDDRTIVWRRDTATVAVDTVTGVATAVAADDPPLVVRSKGRTWQISRDKDGFISATGKPSWRTENPYDALIGAVYMPDQTPIVRLIHARPWAKQPEMLVADLDATGSMNGTVAQPFPGIELLAHGVDSVGNTALAVRLDASLQRDYIIGYAANALLVWVYELPQVPRADAVGLAVTPDAVIVFHDGDTLTVLPDVSAPPTAPGAIRPPSENATP
jgi:hypothetical protein